MTNQKCIVIGINEIWSFTAATFLMSLRNHVSDGLADVIIIHDGLKLDTQEKLRKILPCRFIKFDYPVPDSIRESRGTHMKFSRLICFDLVKEYEKVIWFDTDMLIMKPINELFNYGSSGLAMMSHKRSLEKIYNKTCATWLKNKEFHKYNFNVPVFNSGLMIISKKIRNTDELKNWCFNKMTEWSNTNTSIQPILTLMLQEFNIEVEAVPDKYNCPLNEYSTKTVVLHALGNNKFWHMPEKYPVWLNYYNKWLALGGSGPLTSKDIQKAKITRYYNKLPLPKLYNKLKRYWQTKII